MSIIMTLPIASSGAVAGWTIAAVLPSLPEFTIVAVHDGMVRSRLPTGSAGSLIGASRSPRRTFAA
jgi:hypothetical protein